MSQYYSHDHEPTDTVTHVIFDVDGTILDTEELYNKAKLQVCIILNYKRLCPSVCLSRNVTSSFLI